MGNGWADWDERDANGNKIRRTRVVLEPAAGTVQRVRYCPKCATDRIFDLPNEKNRADNLALRCTRCRYSDGDPEMALTDDETLLMMDKYKLPVPLTESRLAP